MKKLVRAVFSRVSSMLPASWLESWIELMARARVSSLPPDEALRFLFRVDATLYRLEGKGSVRYGKGIHTKHRHTRYHDFFVERVGKGERVLDVGCGHGALAYDIADRAGASVVGIDLDPRNIEKARERFAHKRIEYREGDASKDLQGERFDVVILSNVLEHLGGRPAFLARVLALAEPARVLIRVPSFERDWRVPLKQELGVEWRLDPTHETEYTMESFERELEEGGLHIVDRNVCWGEIWAETIPAALREEF